MPTYHGLKTTVQLSVADLDRATTRNPLTQHGPATRESIRRVTQEFAQGSKDGTLTETYLSAKDKSYIEFPGETPLSTGFLGEPRRMPFFMVHAGKDFFDLTTKENRNRRPCRVPLDKKTKGGSASTAIDLSGEKKDGRTSSDCKTTQLTYNNRLLTLHQSKLSLIGPTNHLASLMLSVSPFSSPVLLLPGSKIKRLGNLKSMMLRSTFTLTARSAPLISSHGAIMANIIP